MKQAYFPSYRWFLQVSAVLLMLFGGPAQVKLLQQEPPPEPPRREAPAMQPGRPQAISSVSPAGASEVAAAMDVPTADLLVAEILDSDPNGAGVSTARLGSWFPTTGSTFAILATGLAADAALPNTAGSHSTILTGRNNSQGNDLVTLHLQLKVPSTANCASFDFAYYSEEYPEFLDSQYNDTFTAQLNSSEIVIQGSVVTATANFAFDTQDNVISANTVFGFSASTGTTYDGSTPLLRARSAVVPDATVDVYLSVMDLGDPLYDSAVFLDNFFWSKDPTCAAGALADTDGDGLLDDWETAGLTVSAGSADELVDLPAMGADPKHKDIFVEIDWMDAPGGGDIHTHAPDAAAVQEIVNAFNHAPVANPDGTSGIHLHVDYGPAAPMPWATAATWGTLSHANALAHQANVSTCVVVEGNPNFQWAGVDALKQANFTAGRAAVFHYSLWVHDLCSELAGTSGISRNPGGADFGSGASDFVVSLGGWPGSTGTPDQQAGTLMHALGHNLGLRHGGEDHAQWKANYLSVMNYAFQTRGLIINNTEGHFDYSRYDLPDLNENSLDETLGIHPTGAAVLGTRYYCASGQQVVMDARRVDWNCNGSRSDNPVSSEINHSGALDTLTSQNDWDHLVFSGGAISLPGTSVVLPAETESIEITYEQDQQIVAIPFFLYLPLARRP